MKLLASDPRQPVAQRGSALVLVLLFGTFLVGLSAVALTTATDETRRSRGEWDLFKARQNAMSGVSEALARIREGGQKTPMSGVPAATSGAPSWVSMGPSGGFYYTTSYDPSGSVYTITSYGRHEVDAGAQAQSTTAPGASYDYSGWMVRGVEVIVVGQKEIPNAPLYFGNGGVEKGRGGWRWNAGNDPLDTSSWTAFYGVNGGSPSGVVSYQSRGLPFRVSALDHPATWLDDGVGGFDLGRPAAGDPGVDGVAGTADDGPDLEQTPHPYSLFAGQTLVGAYNADRWFNEWTHGGTHDPGSLSQPSIDDPAVYPNNDPVGSTIEGDPFPVDTTIPDVQTWAWDMWEKHKNSALHIQPQGSGSSADITLVNAPDGTAPDPANYSIDTTNKIITLGSETNPQVVFVTGRFTIPSNWTVKGHGVIVLRDNYHPDEQTNNTPTGNTNETDAHLYGDFEWTGLAMIAGWRPELDTRNMPAGNSVRILGALFGEDSVQSGGEQSLDTAQIQVYIGPSKADASGNGLFEIFYCREIFEPGGLIYHLLPEVSRQIVSIRDLE
jgi:hypothetical protein